MMVYLTTQVLRNLSRCLGLKRLYVVALLSGALLAVGACKDNVENVQVREGLCDNQQHVAPPLKPLIETLNLVYTPKEKVLGIAGTNLRIEGFTPKITLYGRLAPTLQTWDLPLSANDPVNRNYLEVVLPSAALQALKQDSSLIFDVSVHNGCTTAVMPLSLIALNYPTEDVPFKIEDLGNGEIHLSYFKDPQPGSQPLTVTLHTYPDQTAGAVAKVAPSKDKQFLTVSYYDDAGKEVPVNLLGYGDNLQGSVTKLTPTYTEGNSQLFSLNYYNPTAPEGSSKINLLGYDDQSIVGVVQKLALNADNTLDLSYYADGKTLKQVKLPYIATDNFKQLTITKDYGKADLAKPISSNIYYHVINGKKDIHGIHYFDYSAECLRLGGHICNLTQTEHIVWQAIVSNDADFLKSIEINANNISSYLVDSDVCNTVHVDNNIKTVARDITYLNVDHNTNSFGAAIKDFQCIPNDSGISDNVLCCL